MAKKSSVLIDVLINTDIDSNKENNIPSFWIILELPVQPVKGDEISFLTSNTEDNWEFIREYDDRPITEDQFAYMDEQLFDITRRVFEPDGKITYWAERRL